MWICCQHWTLFRENLLEKNEVQRWKNHRKCRWYQNDQEGLKRGENGFLWRGLWGWTLTFLGVSLDSNFFWRICCWMWICCQLWNLTFFGKICWKKTKSKGEKNHRKCRWYQNDHEGLKRGENGFLWRGLWGWTLTFLGVFLDSNFFWRICCWMWICCQLWTTFSGKFVGKKLSPKVKKSSKM